MQPLLNKYLNLSMLMALGLITSMSYAATGESLAPEDHSVESYHRITDTVVPVIDEKLDTDLPSQSNHPQMSIEESKVYLQQHPEEFETLLSNLLIKGDAKALEELLPTYIHVENYDPSVLDWGNAIIAARKGELDKAVALYRKINAQLPDVDIVRFQMAMALFYNQQYNAAKSEFERLRSDTESQADIKVINKYLTAINEQESWDVYAAVSYLDDRNITNSPEQGTTLTGDDGSVVTASSPRESGKGLKYSLSADKKWRNDNKIFTALHLNSYGNYYTDNKNFNDITAGVGAGLGYQTPITEVEVVPFFNKRWYGQGVNGDGDLHSYSDTTGVKLNLKQWLDTQYLYQGFSRYSETNYIEDYDHNDGDDFLLANTLVYFPNGQQFWTLGYDYSYKDAEDDSSSFDRNGVRLGWGQTWPKGFSTKFDLGYAQRDYDAKDFFGIKRENEEYSVGLSFWKRDFTFLGLTPRIGVDYFKVNSNSPFEEYDKTNISFELTKSF